MRPELFERLRLEADAVGPIVDPDDAEALEEAADLELTARLMANRDFRKEDRKYTAQRDYYRSRSKGRRSAILSRTLRERTDPRGER